MSILPEDKPCQPKKEPHNFFVHACDDEWEKLFYKLLPASVGAQHLRKFVQGTAPSIQIRNVRDERGNF